MSASSKPRFNPWPYSIIGFFALVVVAAVVWVGFCIGHSTDLVAADYYEQEVEYQKQMDRMERVQELSGRASVSYRAEDGFIRIQLPPEHSISDPAGLIHLYRPSQASLDQTLPLQVTVAGKQQVDARALTPGLWDVRVQWTSGGQEFFLTEKINVVGTGS